MALPTTGAHVVCTYAIPPGFNQQAAPILAWVPDSWSESVASGATTNQKAITGSTGPGSGKPIFSIRAFVDGWGAIGPAPDATQTSGSGNTARFPIVASEGLIQIGVNPNDKFSFTAA